MNQSMLADICKTLRHDIITSSTAAGSGHPTSSLSAVELLATLFFGGYFKYDLKNPDNKLNDRVIFSKGHASPLFYALYKVAGAITEEELLTFRKIDSDLEGHPTPRFRYTEASTGSLGQGLSVGLGIAMGMKLHFDAKTTSILPKTYVLLGDSEVAEGQIWEAAEVASHYKMGNLIAILDVNRLAGLDEFMQQFHLVGIANHVAGPIGMQRLLTVALRIDVGTPLQEQPVEILGIVREADAAAIDDTIAAYRRNHEDHHIA